MGDEERVTSKGKRPSLAASDAAVPERKNGSGSYLRGERRLSVTSLRLRTEVEMWMMSSVPKLFGKETAESLDASLQEEAQTSFLSDVLFSADIDDAQITGKIDTAFAKAASTEGFADFKKELLTRIKSVKDAFAQARKESKEIPESNLDANATGDA